MDLLALAESFVGAEGRTAALRWTAELETSPEGTAFVSHMTNEQNLQTLAEGKQAIERLVSALLGRSAGEPIKWYLETAEHQDLAFKGRPAARSLPDQLCKLHRGYAVWSRLASPTDRPAVASSARFVEWLEHAVCGQHYLAALDPTAILRGRVPAVFSTFEQDRATAFPPGTPWSRCWQVVGLDPPNPPEPCVLLRYSLAEVGPARVPTAFDAADNLHFVPVLAGAGWGMTKDLAGGGGVREVVVCSFSVARLRRPEFIGA